MGHWKCLSVGSQRSGSVGKVSGADSVIMSSYNLEGWSRLFKTSNCKYSVVSGLASAIPGCRPNEASRVLTRFC